MNVSPKLQEFFDKKPRSDIEIYLDDLNTKFGLDGDYRSKIAKILEGENIDVVTDPRVEKVILSGNIGLKNLESKRKLKVDYALNYSSNPYFPDNASNDENYSDKMAA
ncbi:MAG: hypothetical protein PHS49_06445 [Candidatus Gracilibacteria bacterium]|nr:hypothetical protein [Candidatus Gracilibacteria bacterium]